MREGAVGEGARAEARCIVNHGGTRLDADVPPPLWCKHASTSVDELKRPMPAKAEQAALAAACSGLHG